MVYDIRYENAVVHGCLWYNKKKRTTRRKERQNGAANQIQSEGLRRLSGRKHDAFRWSDAGGRRIPHGTRMAADVQRHETGDEGMLSPKDRAEMLFYYDDLIPHA